MAVEPADSPENKPLPSTGANNTTVGDISNSQGVAIGTGASVNIDNRTTFIYEAPRAPEKPRLSYEPAMVDIPAGSFVMGVDDDPLAAPQHTVYLPVYQIALYPVTNRQYLQFIRQTKRMAADALLWNGNSPYEETLDQPVAGVTWYEAMAYCQWLSSLTDRPYTLPSEAQWEKAARGTDGRLYPWGNEWQADRCNQNEEQLTAVNAYPAQSVYGCFDMVGNAREWTTSLWGTLPRAPEAKYRYPWQDDGREDTNQPPGVRRVYRGGRGDGISDYRCNARGGFLPDKPGFRANPHGFRVVLLNPPGRNQ
jgi:iron(II)-dependent oxidoreductase